jgi:biopolymer transport protein ExbB/TolQ
MSILLEINQTITKGGFVIWPLIGLALILFYSIIRVWLHMVEMGRQQHPIGHDADPKDISSWVARRREWLLHLDRRLRFIRILTGVAPLLGLLGTVAGMLKTFRGLSIRQTTETMNLVAQGISEALITTETGLTFGIAGTLLLFFIGEYRKRLIARFEGFENRAVLQHNGGNPAC